MNPASPEFEITEVLAEPGVPHVWVTFTNAQSHRIDLTPLLKLAPFRVLNMPRVLQRVSVAPDRLHIHWPGGARVSVMSILQAPTTAVPVRPVAVVPADQRFRPLLPYLKHQVPALYLRPAPISPLDVCHLLGLRDAELTRLLSATAVPPNLVLNRVHDVAVFLEHIFSRVHVHSLVRRDWPYAIRHCPSEPLLHTLLGCLQHHRPDLIERPCMLLATGGI